ncbi:DUF2929 family protein [Apilactobacillus ozensis]|nr:DUF2929 family protein [Apilactobacillus ozensis]MCK8606473.1 YjzD family protein [Apilactobacillus ozensis]
MRFISANLTIIFWSAVFGEVIGYISSDLTSLPYSTTEIAIVSVITAVILVNGINLMMDKKAIEK